MKNVSQMAEQHLREYESRQKHIDELLEELRERTADAPEHSDIHARLEVLEQERDRLIVRLDEFRLRNLENWREEEIEKSGLMGLWDALAQQIESLTERLEK